jgi:hypothetical protein
VSAVPASPVTTPAVSTVPASPVTTSAVSITTGKLGLLRGFGNNTIHSFSIDQVSSQMIGGEACKNWLAQPKSQTQGRSKEYRMPHDHYPLEYK